MENNYAFPLPAGSKLAMSRKAGMSKVLQMLLDAPDGMISASAIGEQTELPSNLISGCLRLLKIYGIVGNTYAKRGDNYKLWWIVPTLRHNLSIFTNSLE